MPSARIYPPSMSATLATYKVLMSLARAVSEEALEGKNAQFTGPDDFSDLMMENDRVLSY